MPATPPGTAPAVSSGCIFCAILRGDAPASRIVDRERAVAFLTLGPLQPGHTLVVPRTHAVTLHDVSPVEWAAVAEVAREVAALQRDRLGAAGTSLFLASGEAGEQAVPHLHLHVVPRHVGDGVEMTAWWEGKVRRTTPAELESIATRMRAPSRKGI